MFRSPAQKDPMKRGNPGFGPGTRFGESTAFPTNSLREQRGEGGLWQRDSPKRRISNGQSSPRQRDPGSSASVVTGHHALQPAGQGQDGPKALSGGVWNPPFQISWLLSICLANSILSTLKRLLISFLDNKNLSEVVIKCIFIYLWE